MSNHHMLGEQADNLRQEKSLEQKHKMDRLEIDGLAEDSQPSNKSLTGPENHHQHQFESHGMEPDVHMSHGNRDISHGQAPDSAGLSHTSDSEDDIDKDEEDVQKLLTEINNEAILDLKNEETETALDSLKRGEQMLEFITSEGREVDRNLIIVILYNQACCYQRLNMLPDCASYLDGTIYNLEQKVTNFEDDEEFLNMVTQTGQNEMLLGNTASDPLGNNSISAVSNNLSQGGWDRAMLNLSPEEQLKKFNISSKLFKLRYLCKYHLQLCAVLSQLLRNKEALQHGMMASFYCQELIRNTQYLCHGYIHKLQQEKKSNKQKSSSLHGRQASANENQGIGGTGQAQTNQEGIAAGVANPNSDEEEPIIIGKQQTYYVEENERFLNLLISNCEPILGQIVNKFDRFNKINGIEQAFEQQQGTGGGMYGEDSDDADAEDILSPIIDEFSIKEDVNIKNFTMTTQQSSSTTSKVAKNKKGGAPTSKNEGQAYSYTNLKNNYLGRISSPLPDGTDLEKRSMRDEQTPEQMFERKLSSTEQHAYYNVNKGLAEDQQTLQKSESGHVKLQDNVKTILGVKDQDDWIFNLNIGNVMHLLPMSLEELNLHVDNSHELSRDAMLEKIILLSVSYFCVGTELRFLSKQFNAGKGPKSEQGGLEDMDGNADSKKYRLEDSEMWHAMALESCGTFLPSECPLVSHMIMSFQKHHSPAMTTIPEDQVLDEDIKVLRPLNEVKMDQINYHQIIRSFLKPQVVKPVQQQQAETGGKQGKSKYGGFVDQSGRVIPGKSNKPVTKGTLLRGGGIPTGPSGNRKSIKQPAKSGANQEQKLAQTRKQAAGEEAKEAQDEGENGQFYNMDELAGLLGLPATEFSVSSRAQNSQNQMIAYVSSSTKDGKTTSVETFTDSSTVNQPSSEVLSKVRGATTKGQTLSPGTPQNQQSSHKLASNSRKSTGTAQEQAQPSSSQQKKSLQNLLVKLTEVQGQSPSKQANPGSFTHEPQSVPKVPPQASQSAMMPSGKRKQFDIIEDQNQLDTTPQQVPNMGALAAPPTTIASLAEENQILMKYLQKKQLKKQKDQQKEKKSSATGLSSKANQKPSTAQAVINLARDTEFIADFQKQAPRPQSKKVGRVTASGHEKVSSRLVKSPNQIQFNPATQTSADHSDMPMPENQQMSSGKKLIRKVKKGNSSGMSKSDINALAMASGNHNLTGNTGVTSKANAHSKNNMTLQQTSGFSGGIAMGGSNSRVLSGNSQSAGAGNMKSQTLKSYSASTQNLSKTGLNNIRLKQLVQLQTKAIQGINSAQQQPKTSQGMRISSNASQPMLSKASTKSQMKQFV